MCESIKEELIDFLIEKSIERDYIIESLRNNNDEKIKKCIEKDV